MPTKPLPRTPSPMYRLRLSITKEMPATSSGCTQRFPSSVTGRSADGAEQFPLPNLPPINGYRDRAYPLTNGSHLAKAKRFP